MHQHLLIRDSQHLVCRAGVIFLKEKGEKSLPFVVVNIYRGFSIYSMSKTGSRQKLTVKKKKCYQLPSTFSTPYFPGQNVFNYENLCFFFKENTSVFKAIVFPPQFAAEKKIIYFGTVFGNNRLKENVRYLWSALLEKITASLRRKDYSHQQVPFRAHRGRKDDIKYNVLLGEKTTAGRMFS